MLNPIWPRSGRHKHPSASAGSDKALVAWSECKDASWSQSKKKKKNLHKSVYIMCEWDIHIFWSLLVLERACIVLRHHVWPMEGHWSTYGGICFTNQNNDDLFAYSFLFYPGVLSYRMMFLPLSSPVLFLILLWAPVSHGRGAMRPWRVLL